MRKTANSVLIGFVLFIYSCGPATIHKSETSLPETGWTYQDSIIFNFEITDTTGAYDFILNIEHSPEYSYENLYLRVSTIIPDTTPVVDIMPINFSDNFGQWIASCSNKSCELPVIMQENFFFQSPGKYQLIFEQHSREDTLKGINKLAILIKEAEHSGSN